MAAAGHQFEGPEGMNIADGELCHECRIILDRAVRLNQAEPSEKDLVQAVGFHHSSFEALQLSSSQCRLCWKLYVHIIERSLGCVIPVWIRTPKMHHEHKGNFTLAANFVSPQDFGCPEIEARETPSTLYIGCNSSFVDVGAAFTEILRSGSEPHRAQLSPLGFQRRKRLLPDICNEKTVRIIEEWISHCHKSHPTCKTYSPSYMPSRLISVGSDEQNPCLVITGQYEPEQYLTLSHCWGGEVPLSLTSDREGVLKCGVPLTKFPKTFRDAILITRKLNVRYIWIDSLCIIQGDADDWHRESLTMSKVYEGALLNICVSAAPNAEAGFLYPRDDGTIPFTIRLDRKSYFYGFNRTRVPIARTAGTQMATSNEELGHSRRGY
jgi:hypothetical protein